MNSTRSKRWNGDLDSLPADYLKGMMEKMHAYGDRVQLSLVSAGPQPSYQVINNVGKVMAFDRNHHLLRPQENEFTGPNATQVFTLERIKAALSGSSSAASAGARKVRVARSPGDTRTAAARLHDMYAAQRYEYFKNHRQALPPAITEYSDEITDLMKKGMPVEEAFGEVLKKYF